LNATPHLLELAGALPFQPGEFGVHPAPGEDLILRFTAPSSGVFNVSAAFFMKHSNGVSVTVQKSGVTIGQGVTKPLPYYFARSLELRNGDNRDFIVGLGGFALNSNTTSVNLVTRGAR